MPSVLPKILVLTMAGVLPVLTLAQQPQQATPPVKVNVLNVCSPSADEQKEIASALGRVPEQPQFAPDFEVARGRSSLSERAAILQGVEGAAGSVPITAAWVRIRRDFPSPAQFSSVQYSFSADSKSMIETLVLHLRDPKDLVQISIEDTASAVTSPASMLASSTPVDRIRLERFGRPSVVLARCLSSVNGPPPDQSAYEPLFRSALSVLGRYRELLGARRTVPEELAKVVTSGAAKPRAAGKPPAKKPASESK